MIKDKLNELIKESMKAKDNTRTLVLRAIKTEFSKIETAKNAKDLDESQVIRKMISDRLKSMEIYMLANKFDLAKTEESEIKILKEFLPEEPNEETIRIELSKILLEIELKQENIGKIMKSIKDSLPEANMKVVHNILKEMI